MPIVRAGHMIREHVRDGARLLRQFRVPLRLFGIVPFADRVEVVAGGQFGGHLEPRQRIAPSIAEQRLEIFVLELPIVEPWIPQHPPHHIVRQVMREARAQLLAGDVAVEAKIPELRDIAADRVADGEVSEVAVVRASKRIVVDEGIALEHLPPCEQVREVVLERVRQHDPVARVRRRLRQIVEVHVGVAAFEGARDRREHHREALGVPDRLVFGGEQQLMVEQEADVHIQPFLGEAFIERVEEAHVLVRRQPFAAFVAFADVVPGVGEPYVQVVDVRVLARIVDDELDHARRHFGVREIEARQDRRSVDELSSAVEFGDERFLLLGYRQSGFPSVLRRIAEHFAGPPVSHTVLHDAACAHRLVDAVAHLLRDVRVEGLCVDVRIEFVLIPALEERVRILELHEERVEAELGQPIDEIDDVPDAVGAFDADAAMREGGGLMDVKVGVVEDRTVELRQPFAGGARLREARPEFVGEAVHGDQQRDVGVRVDREPAAGERDVELVLELGVLFQPRRCEDELCAGVLGRFADVDAEHPVHQPCQFLGDECRGVCACVDVYQHDDRCSLCGFHIH